MGANVRVFSSQIRTSIRFFGNIAKAKKLSIKND